MELAILKHEDCSVTRAVGAHKSGRSNKVLEDDNDGVFHYSIV